MTLESLEIYFQVQMGDARAQLQALGNEIDALGAQAVKAKSTGYALSSGFAQGILNGRSLVVNAASAVAKAAISKLKSSLQIHSPSRVAREMGDMFSRGFALGVLDSAAQSSAAAAHLSNVTTSGMHATAGIAEVGGMGVSQAVYAALKGLEITAPMYVDGMKLGQAAIRGINAVNRASGRQMLEI